MKKKTHQAKKPKLIKNSNLKNSKYKINSITKNPATKDFYPIEVRIFKWILFVFPFFLGLFFEFTTALAGIFLTIFLFYLIIKNKTINIALNINSILLIFVFLSYLLVLPWAVDWGMALIGFLKFSTVIIFILVLMQFDRSQISECYQVIPWSGCIMVILTGLSYFIPNLSGYFIDAGRLGGFFQYANSFALFLLIGLIIIAESKIINPKEISKLVVLIGGLLLTGSRISLIMLGCILIYYALLFPRLRKAIILIGISIFVIITAIFLLAGDTSTITRITTIFSNPSTLLGRFLYAKDAWMMLMKNPFGLGYMGYYYLQPQFQTGFYTSRFVHQAFLQIGLDAGIPALIAFISLCFRSLFSKKMLHLEKTILIIILIHACFDFDFQYLIILYILIMTLDLGESKKYPSKNILIISKVTLSIIGFVYCYFFTAHFTDYMGYQNVALKMLPFNTEIKIYALSQAQTEGAIEYWADEILVQNKTIALAFEAKAILAANRNDYDNMVKNMEKMLLNDPYNLKKYQQFLSTLEETMNYYNTKGNIEEIQKYAQIALSIPNRLQAVKQKTSNLAYQIDNQPHLELTENEIKYLDDLNKLMDQLPKK